MKYIKYVVAVLGYFIFDSLWGAFFGFLLGGYISFKLSGGLLGQLSGFGNVGGIGGMAGLKTEKQSAFFETVFTLMGKLAKADGRVSETEIAHVESFMKQLNMSADNRKQAIAHFKTGSKIGYDASPLIQNFNRITTTSPNLKQMLMVYLTRVAAADGGLHQKESEVLRDIAQQMGYSAQAFEQLMAMLQGQDQFAGGRYHQNQQRSGYSTNRPNSYSEIDSAYKALGVKKDNTDSEIKKAYRRLVREYHPDKLMGQGLPEEMIKEATERSQEIQTAYDIIKKSRGM